MRLRAFLIAAGACLAFLGCGGDGTGPNELDSFTLVPEFTESAASSVDAAGIGGARLPPELALTAEQKATIAALHEGFKAGSAADVAALRAIEAEARAAHKAGKGREEIQAILARGAPIVARLHEAFVALQRAIWQVYTAEQRAWIDAHRPKPCDSSGPPPLTDAQHQQIRELQAAFMEAVKPDLELIKQVVEEARQAAQAGATRTEIATILHRADAARERVRSAEQRLQQAIEAILTKEQRERRCQPPGGGR